ncbi:unnamed protein product [Spodoptera exigua]|nr:unnamed protein product [Spodoptera exigua]
MDWGRGRIGPPDGKRVYGLPDVKQSAPLMDTCNNGRVTSVMPIFLGLGFWGLRNWGGVGEGKVLGLRMARPTHLVLLLITLGVVHTSQGHARSFTRCQLSRELLRYNFPRSMIPNWVCLIEHASGRTTDKVTNHNNSYTSYGLFQKFLDLDLEQEKERCGFFFITARQLPRRVSRYDAVGHEYIMPHSIIPRHGL